LSVKMRTSYIWTKRPYEVLLYFEIENGQHLRSLGGRRRRIFFGKSGAISEIPLSCCSFSHRLQKAWDETFSDGQFFWGGSLLKGNGGVQRFSQAGRKSVVEYKGKRELHCKTYKSNRDESRS